MAERRTDDDLIKKDDDFYERRKERLRSFKWRKILLRIRQCSERERGREGG